MVIEWTKTESGTCKRLEDVPEGARIEAVDDVACVGQCEGCAKTILEGEPHEFDSEGALVCQGCMS